MKTKLRLHAIDNIGNDTGPTDDVEYRKVVKRIEAVRPIASRYIFDAEASAYLGRFIRDCPDMIIANRQFAIPPYESTYVQLDSRVLLKTIGRRTTDEVYGEETADSEVGYLIHRDTVYGISQRPEGSAGVGIFKYDRNVPSGIGPIFDLPINVNDPDDEWVRAAILLGSTFDDITDEDTRLDIVRSTRITPTFSTMRYRHASEVDRRQRYTELAICSFGDLRNLIAALLLLNQRQHVHTDRVPWSAGLVHGKRRIFTTHNLVRIKLTGGIDSVRRTFQPSLAVPRRRHNVAGFFQHWHLGEGCVHSWPPLPEISLKGTPRWQCQRCGGLRVWVKEHKRGHGGEGVVVKDYLVSE